MNRADPGALDVRTAPVEPRLLVRADDRGKRALEVARKHDRADQSHCSLAGRFDVPCWKVLQRQLGVLDGG